MGPGLIMALWLAAAPEAGGFVEDRLRLAETYARAGEPVAAVAPLLAVLRRGEAGPAAGARAKLLLAEAYVDLGLYGAARRLLGDLHGGGEAATAARLHLKLAVRSGAGPRQVLQALLDYAQAAGEVDAGLLLEAGRSAFLNPATDVSTADAMRLLAADPRPVARYFRGVLRLRAGDVEAAFRELDGLRLEIDRGQDRALFDQVHLALGRIYYEAGRHGEAERFYAAVDERSTAHDAALYETAWVYWSQNDATAAAGNLLRLAIDYPFSPLVPKAQVFYGYLMLQRGDFAAAERAFAAYIARYTSIVETVAELSATESDDALFARLYGELDEAIAGGNGALVEVGAWLEADARMRAVAGLVAKLRAVEHELADAARTLREVQTAAEIEETGDPEAERELAALREQIDAAAAIGERLTGRAGEAQAKVAAELANVAKLRVETGRLRRRAGDKRRELVSLLQYADAGQWQVWSEDGRLAPGAATAPVEDDPPAIGAMLARLDRGERDLLRTLSLTDELEHRALQARAALVAPLVEPARRPGLAAALAEYALRRGEVRAAERERLERRIARAVRARREAETRVAELKAARRRLVALSAETAALRGEVARDEMARIEARIGALLVHARLGDADVAWAARTKARERAAAVARREQADVQGLQAFYRSLADVRSRAEPEAAAPATGSTLSALQSLVRAAGAYERAAGQVGEVLVRRKSASAALAERLRAEGHADDLLNRADAAGVFVGAPEVDASARVVSVLLVVDGRAVRAAQRDVLFDGYLLGGSHQFDAAVTVVDGAGRVTTLRGTAHVRLRQAEGYRLRLKTEAAEGGRRLFFALERGGV